MCAPFRTNINHQNAYLFKNSIRSRTNKSDIDYSKTLIIKDLKYLDGNQVVDKDEYNETSIRIEMIKNNIISYINDYVNHHNNIKKFHLREYNRRYRYTTLKYFHDF